MAKRAIMIGIDGCHRDTLYRLIDEKQVPFFNWMADNGVRVKNAVTMFPSTTASCCATLYTGSWYRSHGLLNNEWVDRFADPPRGRSYIECLYEALLSFDKKLFGLPTILLPDRNEGGQINNDLCPDHPTIYEEMTAAGKISYTFFHYIGKGATVWARPARTDMLRYGMIEQYGKPYQMFDKMMATRAIRLMRKRPADLLAIYYGGNDGHSHRHGVPGQETYLRDFIDKELTRLKTALEAMFPQDELYWSVCADHGQSNLDKEKHLERCMWIEDFFPQLRAAGFEKMDRGLSRNELGGLDVIGTLGHGAGAGFYIKNRKTGDWKTPPDFASDIVPALNNFMKASAGLAPFGDYKFKGYLDFLLTRTRFDEPYRVYVNKPPYDAAGELVPLEERFKGGDPAYVKPIERLRGIDSPKGPDIVLLLDYCKNRFNINTVEGFHPGQHGSLCPDDSYVPMLFAGPGVIRGELPEAFTINWSPTVASMLGVKMPRADGAPLPIFGNGKGNAR